MGKVAAFTAHDRALLSFDDEHSSVINKVGFTDLPQVFVIPQCKMRNRLADFPIQSPQWLASVEESISDACVLQPPGPHWGRD
jgi:hypothetical protein